MNLSLTPAIEAWTPVDLSNAAQLSEARLWTHWAVQPVSALAAAMVPASPDDSHTSLRWHSESASISSQPGPGGLHARFDLRTLQIALAGEDDKAIGSVVVAGRKLSDLLEWLSDAACLALPHAKLANVALHSYDMPDHPVRHGDPFPAADRRALDQLVLWFGNAERFVRAVADATGHRSAVRLWPHHFDLATLITLDRAADHGETARSIGFGLSPGDADYHEPYFYLNPWPRPDPEAGLPVLQGEAIWHRTDWVGAVLPASRMSGRSAEEQAGQVAMFVASALKAARMLLSD